MVPHIFGIKLNYMVPHSCGIILNYLVPHKRKPRLVLK